MTSNPKIEFTIKIAKIHIRFLVHARVNHIEMCYAHPFRTLECLLTYYFLSKCMYNPSKLCVKGLTLSIDI